MLDRNRRFQAACALSLAIAWAGCGSPEGAVLVADAQYDPVAASNAGEGVSEVSGVAQTFTVLAAGKFEVFWVVLIQGSSVDDGVVRITVRPLVAGVPNPAEGSSIITPIDVDTTTLPTIEQFTEFNVGSDPGREVLPGEQYAIVVEFVSRTGVDANQPIAEIRGTDGGAGDPYADGTAAENNGGGYVANANMDDYIFRTFVLQP